MSNRKRFSTQNESSVSPLRYGYKDKKSLEGLLTQVIETGDIPETHLWSCLHFLTRKMSFTSCKKMVERLLSHVVYNESLFPRVGDTRIRELLMYCRARGAHPDVILLALTFELKSIRRVCFVDKSRVTPDLENFPDCTDVGRGVFASVDIEEGETFYEVITVGETGAVPL